MGLKKNGCIRLLVLVFSLALSARALADLDGAKKALDTVKKNIADDNMANIDQDVKMVEFELKDTPDADKKPIQDELNTIKKKIHDDKVAKFRPDIEKSLESYFTNAKEALADNRPDAAVGEADRLDEYLTHDDIKEVFTDDEIAKYKERMNKLRLMGQSGMADAKITIMEKDFGDYEKAFPGKLTELKGDNEGQAQMLVNSMSQELGVYATHMNDLPADNDKVKALKARLAKLNTDFASAAGAADAAAKLDSLKSNWDSYNNEFGGWEAETTPITFDQYSKGVGNTDVHAFNMPHSVKLITRADDFMKNRSEDPSFKEIANDPTIKAFLDTIAKARADCYAKLVKNITGVVEQAEKVTFSNDNIGQLHNLPDDIRLALGEKSPEGEALKARAQKLIDNYQNGLKAADAAFEETYKKMCEAAGKAWPDMAAKYSPQSGFDPAKYQDWKGKTIKITTDNLMGYKFKPGDFPFATTLNGLPVACKYNPVVAAAITDVEAKVKHTLGDIDQDGKWDIICTVDGNTGRMNTRQTNDLTNTSGQRVATFEDSVPVDAPIVTIIAAHCGPLAVSADQGAVNESGVIAAPTGATLGSGAAASTSSGGTGWFLRFLFLIVGLVAAASALLKSGYAPVANIPQAGELQAKLGGDNLAYIGLGCAAWGVLWLLYGLIIHGLLPNLAIIAAGLYAALDFLAAKGIVKPDQVAQIKPLGVKIGLGCAAIVVLALLIGGKLVII